MDGLTIVNRNGRFVADSREVAEMVGKTHAHLLRDVDSYARILTESNFGLSDFFIETTYQDSTGRTLKRYDITRKGCDMVANKMIGEKGVLFTAAYVTKFEEMERNQQMPRQLTRLELIELARESELARIEAEKKNAELEYQLRLQEPKVIFADAITTSPNSILIRELAVILKQNGIEIGEKRLFEWLRNNGYLIKRLGTDRNTPTQKSMELGLFEIKETPIVHSGGLITVGKTPKVTGKGQIYFVNFFKKELTNANAVVIVE